MSLKNKNITRVALVVPKVKKDTPIALPYGLASIAGYVLENCKNVEIKFFDESIGCDINMELIKFNPHIVGVTSNTVQIYKAHKILGFAKKAFNSLTVIGGIHVSSLPEESLIYSDIVVVNDGEIVFKEIIENYQKGILSKGIFQGVEIKNLDDVTIPYHLLNVKGYLEHSSWVLPSLEKPMVMITSRGCPFKCLFCYNSKRKPSVRHQSAKKIVSDVLFLHKEYGITNFYFGDDNFLLNVNRFKEIAKLFVDNKIGHWIQWGCQTRARNLSFETLTLAKNVGMIELSLGIERGDERLLSLLKDKTNISDNETVLSFCKKLKINVGGGTIWGYFDETKEDMEKSFKWLTTQTNLSFIAVGCIIVYPTAKIWEIYKQKGFLPKKVNYEKLLQTNYAFDTYFHLEHMNKQKFAKRLLHYSRLLRLYAEVNRTYSFKHFFFRMSRNKRWWWGWFKYPIHMIKMVYRILENKKE